MTKFSEVLAAGLTLRESADDGSDFTNPAADYRRVFLGEDGELHAKDSSGTVTDLGGGGAPTFSGARVFHSTTQTVSAGVETTATFDSEVYDTDAYHDGGSPTRLTVPATGYYQFNSRINLAGSTGSSYAYLRVDGTTAVTGSEMDSTTGVNTLTPSATLSLTAGQYVEVRAFRTNGTTFGATTGAFSCAFEVVRLG